MKFTITKFLILILIALFFASTNELSDKEAEQNYKSESHSFIETVSYATQSTFNFNIIAQNFASIVLINHQDEIYSGKLHSGNALNYAPPIIKPKIFLDISILLI